LGEIINIHGSRMFGNATILKQTTNWSDYNNSYKDIKEHCCCSLSIHYTH
jgi:hypothetical protein